MQDLALTLPPDDVVELGIDPEVLARHFGQAFWGLLPCEWPS